MTTIGFGDLVPGTYSVLPRSALLPIGLNLRIWLCSAAELHAVLHAVHPHRIGAHLYDYRAGASPIHVKLGAVAGLVRSPGRVAASFGRLWVRDRRVRIAKGADGVDAEAVG